MTDLRTPRTPLTTPSNRNEPPQVSLQEAKSQRVVYWVYIINLLLALVRVMTGRVPANPGPIQHMYGLTSKIGVYVLGGLGGLGFVVVIITPVGPVTRRIPNGSH